MTDIQIKSVLVGGHPGLFFFFFLQPGGACDPAVSEYLTVLVILYNSEGTNTGGQVKPDLLYHFTSTKPCRAAGSLDFLV